MNIKMVKIKLAARKIFATILVLLYLLAPIATMLTLIKVLTSGSNNLLINSIVLIILTIELIAIDCLLIRHIAVELLHGKKFKNIDLL